jgi:hypothetical protein
MKTLLKPKILLFYAVVTGLLSPNCFAQVVKTNQVSAQLTKGQSANGIYAEIEVNWNTNKYLSPTITIFAIDLNADNIFGGKNLGTNWLETFAHDLQYNHWLYFEAANSFCGPIELRDTMGQEVPLINTSASSPEAYPSSYSLSAEWSRHFTNHQPTVSLRPKIFPLPLVRPTSQLTKFQLEDYFDIKEPGEYKLTVWPKIYKRASPNDDLCQRIDLPPVSVTIKWNGDAQKTNSPPQP